MYFNYAICFTTNGTIIDIIKLKLCMKKMQTNIDTETNVISIKTYCIKFL